MFTSRKARPGGDRQPSWLYACRRLRRLSGSRGRVVELCGRSHVVAEEPASYEDLPVGEERGCVFEDPHTEVAGIAPGSRGGVIQLGRGKPGGYAEAGSDEDPAIGE